ncbi:MAG: AMP-binding protein [Sphingomonadaceae bacterium]
MDERVAELLTGYSDREASVAHLLCDRYEPDRRAFRIVGPDLSARDITYGELREESERFAAALQSLGIRPGDRVATLMGKSRRYLVALMAIWRIGAVHVPLFTAFAPPAIAYRLDGSGAKVVVCDESQRGKLAPGDDIPANPDWQVITTGPPTDEALSFDALLEAGNAGMAAAKTGGDAPLIHIYTSGTTGNPKGVIVPVRALAAFHAYCEFGYDLREDDVFWCAADPGWAYGLYYAIIGTLQTGVPSILLEAGFSAELTMAVLAQENVTNFAAAPTVYRALRSSGVPVPEGLALRCASSAGEPLTPEVNEWTQKEFGVLVHDHYGQTEAGMLVNNHHHPQVARDLKAGSMGCEMPGWKAVVLDEERDEELGPGKMGRLAIRLADSPLAWFNGYHGDAAKSAGKFTADGAYYLTGDTAMVDEDGYFTFSARDDDVIIMAGYRIGPFEVESTLATHEAVVESAVIAVPDEVRGEVMEAYAVLAENHAASEELASDLQQWVKQRFAAHAFRAVHFIKEMPKTPSGKIQRFVLKQRRLEELDGPA